MVFQNKIIYRGDSSSIVLIVRGDQTARALRFVVKETLANLTRLLDKANALFSDGSSLNIGSVYYSNTDTSEITVYFKRTDTENFTPKDYVYDLISQNTIDNTDSYTIANGILTVTADVQTPQDAVFIQSIKYAIGTLPLQLDNIQALKVTILNVSADESVLIYVGGSDISALNGLILGNNTAIEMSVSNLNEIYLTSNGSGTVIALVEKYL